MGGPFFLKWIGVFQKNNLWSNFGIVRLFFLQIKKLW